MRPKIAITGNDTLAAATRRCCAKHFDLTFDRPDLLWICHDTPIGPKDAPDVDQLLAWVRADLTNEGVGSPPALISSQIPIGTIAFLEREHPGLFLAYSPENLRVKTAEADFSDQSRVVIGRRSDRHDALFSAIFEPFTKEVIFTDPETAEMCKHALNTHLGLSIAWINEIAAICEQVGADVSTVTRALRTDRRISPFAPLVAGAPFGGGHLARDIHTLERICRERSIFAPLIGNIRGSNSA